MIYIPKFEQYMYRYLTEMNIKCNIQNIHKIKEMNMYLNKALKRASLTMMPAFLITSLMTANVHGSTNVEGMHGDKHLHHKYLVSVEKMHEEIYRQLKQQQADRKEVIKIHAIQSTEY